ncbi:transposase [Streptomyces microflavus]|uniref:transposase n=1 Tax=Streptomyces microflavus TaxID=1919 RepID=UPI00382A31F8
MMARGSLDVTRDLVLDDLWTRIAPIPPPPPQRRLRCAGRRRTCDRTAPAGTNFVLRSGVTWRDMPRREVVAPGSQPGIGYETRPRPASGHACISRSSPSCRRRVSSRSGRGRWRG